MISSTRDRIEPLMKGWHTIKRLGEERWSIDASMRKKIGASILAAAFLTTTYLVTGADSGKTPTKVIHTTEGGFKRQRILGDPYRQVLKSKEDLLTRTTKDYQETKHSTAEVLIGIQNRLNYLEQQAAARATESAHSPQPLPTHSVGLESQSSSTNSAGQQNQTEQRQPANQGTENISIQESSHRSSLPRITYWGAGVSETQRVLSKGPSVVSFPVPDTGVKPRNEIALPVGSYVKAKILTGVEAPEGQPYPVLLQLDFANILPNRKTMDLSGCFMIAKAQGDLSTERVQMQATKLSCIARNGSMFERDINGFAADGGDNAFAVTGSVNSKQDRVAAIAFLSSVVDGIGRSIQTAQTSELTTKNGSQHKSITGDETKFALSGGASAAGSMVAQWYLKQAQSLLPTIRVGSGQDVWVVMNESVGLPNSYFRMNSSDGGQSNGFSFVSNLLR